MSILQSLQHWIDHELGQQASILDTIRMLKNESPFTVDAILASLMDDARACEEVARKSVVHPNGFYKIVLLAPASATYQLRLHVWSTPVGTRGDIHNHRWDFASWIIKGAFTQELFRVSGDDGQAVNHLIWQSDCSEGPVGFVQSTCKLTECRKTESLSDDDTYFLQANDIHRFCSLCRGLSLILHGPPVRTYSDVFRPVTDNAHRPEPPYSIDSSEVVDVLKRARSIIAGAN